MSPSFPCVTAIAVGGGGAKPASKQCNLYTSYQLYLRGTTTGEEDTFG